MRFPVAAILALSLSLGASRNAIGNAPCNRLLDEMEPCPSCDIQECVCLFTGMPCMNRIVCHFRPLIDSGFVWYESIPTFCRWEYPCASESGGLCHPIFNKCRVSSTPFTSGSWWEYQQVALCGIS